MTLAGTVFKISTISPSDGRLIVMGQSSGNQTVSRFSVDGVLDTTFATSGVFSANLGYLGGEASVSVQPDGKIIIARTVYSSYPTVANVRVARLNADGTLDTTFGDNGWATIHFGSSSQADVEYTLAIQADGQIIVAGGADEAGNYDWALARIQGGYNRAWAQHDANFNITAFTDNSGKVVQRFVYSAYGVQTVPTGAWVVSGASNSMYGFQGGKYDVATGMNHFGARDYNPMTGTWTTVDPACYINGSDFYQIELNRPDSLLDPTGTQIDVDVSALINLINGFTQNPALPNGVPTDQQLSQIFRMVSTIEHSGGNSEIVLNTALNYVSTEVNALKSSGADPSKIGAATIALGRIQMMMRATGAARLRTGFVSSEFLGATPSGLISAGTLFGAAYAAIRGSADALDLSTEMTRLRLEAEELDRKLARLQQKIRASNSLVDTDYTGSGGDFCTATDSSGDF